MKTSLTLSPAIIAVKTQKGNKPLNLNEILYLEASNKHTLIHLIDGRCIEINHLLKQFEEELPSLLFCRCHNSYILNNVYVDYVNGNSVYLTIQTIIPLSRKWKQMFMDNYKLFKQLQISFNVNYELLGLNAQSVDVH